MFLTPSNFHHYPPPVLQVTQQRRKNPPKYQPDSQPPCEAASDSWNPFSPVEEYSPSQEHNTNQENSIPLAVIVHALRINKEKTSGSVGLRSRHLPRPAAFGYAKSISQPRARLNQDNHHLRIVIRSLSKLCYNFFIIGKQTFQRWTDLRVTCAQDTSIFTSPSANKGRMRFLRSFFHAHPPLTKP